VHNEIAHDALYPDTERAIAADLAEICDVIIQLHDHTAAFVRDSFNLPFEKLATIPHASYLGVYEDERDARAARAFVGVDPGVPTVGFIGQLRPYKGVDALFRAANLVAAEVPELTLLVAGKLAPRDAAKFYAAMPKLTRVILHTDFVEPSNLWKWFRASDVVALPYRKVLNSGSIPLAATFDRTCLIPDDTAVALEYADEPWVRTYKTTDDPDRALADAIRGGIVQPSAHAAAASAFARRNQPYEMSRAYLDLLDRSVVDRLAAT
jgi:glycosyltransferase involved in cell wall biosynthesis